MKSGVGLGWVDLGRDQVVKISGRVESNGQRSREKENRSKPNGEEKEEGESTGR